MDAVVSKAKNELKAINEQLRALNERRDNLARFLTLYNELAAESDAVEPRVEAVETTRRDTAKDRILDATRSILSDGEARHTRVLLEKLGVLGIEVGGKNKLLALSALLSKSDDFESSRKVGWSLSNPKKSSPEPAVTDSGLFIHSGSHPDPTS